MSNTIGPLGNVGSPQLQPGSFRPLDKPGGGGFQELLKGALQSTASQQTNAEQSIEDHLAGRDVSNVEVMTDVRKADLALRMMLQMRNKMLEAFNEIKQMQF